MAKRDSITNLPNSNPKLRDFLQAPGPSAKPPIAGRIPSRGKPPSNRRGM